MPTLGTQNISTSYPQLLKTFGTSGLPSAGAVEVITDGDNTSSALSIGIDAVQSTGSFTVSSNSSLLGPVTFGTSLTASTGTATIGTLSVGTATISTATIPSVTLSTATISTASISTATIPLQLGAITFGSNITASTGTATIGTATISTATISSATIPRINGATTFATGFTSSTGTNTIGTIESTTINNTGLATVGTLEIGGLAGPKITNVSYGTFAFTSATVQTHAANDTTTGTFALPCQLGDIVIASINSLGSTTGTGALISTSFFPIATDVVEYNIIGKGTTAGTIPAGTIFAAALRFTA
jgi:hypothetical protein